MLYPTAQKYRFLLRASWLLLAVLLALAVVHFRWKNPTIPSEKPAIPSEITLIAQLTDARIDTAKLKLHHGQPSEAFALLISALKNNRTSAEAQQQISSILSNTTWTLPALHLKHPLPVEQIAIDTPSSLWVSLSGKTNTCIRWNLQTLKIESVLFPLKNSTTRSLIFDSASQSIVIERSGVTLLCDGKTLKPIRDLGPLPDTFPPASVITFSPDGLLFAHPNWSSETDHSITWRIRDSATGEIIRSSEAFAPDTATPLAATLNRERLRILHADGSLLEIPISPVRPTELIEMPEPVKLQQAQFANNGNSVLTLIDMGPQEPPSQSVIAYEEPEDGSLEMETLIQRFPWSHQPNIWKSLIKSPESRSFFVDDQTLKIRSSPHALIVQPSPIAALAFTPNHVMLGEKNGDITQYRFLLPPALHPDTGPPKEALPLDESTMKSLENLASALTGIRYNEADRSFTPIEFDERTNHFVACDFEKIHAIFPHLDFAQLITSFKNSKFRVAEPDATQAIIDRLSRATPADESSPEIQEIIDIFHSGDSEMVLAAIQSAGEKGPLIAKILALALQSEKPEWIQACLARARDLPPLLKLISHSRIAWLQGRKADSLANWPEPFPSLDAIRQREDWDGWEQADFQPALDTIRQEIDEVLASIQLPPDSNSDQRKAIADRLAAPETMLTVGKPRFALACFNLAIALSEAKQEPEITTQLAHVARNLGAPIEACLRVEALAYTALGNFQRSRERWIELITEHPVKNHQPADYTEAANASFENQDLSQGIEILNTGIQRFSKDSDFALRAGWLALLIGNPERAYHYLRAGRRIGFAEDKQENATALLAIASYQAGASADASDYFQELLLINPTWEHPETLDILDWPEEMKSVLLNFTQPHITPDLLPELVPTNP